MNKQEVQTIEATGVFVTGVDSDEQGPYYTTTQKTMRGIPLLFPLPPSTPITEALDALIETKALTAADREILTPAPVGVRTLGDLAEVVRRGEIANEKLAGKIAKLLGVEVPNKRVKND